jgi:uncharacterized protein (DUF4415 family)
MPANAGTTKKHKLPTLEDVDHGEVSLDEYEAAHGEDIPELSAEDIARARPVSDFPELNGMFERARGQRGPQKAQTKERIGLRLDRDVVEHFRRTGSGWQGRINEVLAKYVHDAKS